MSLWTREEAARATGGRAEGAPWTAMGVSIDTRESSPGDLFVALRDRRDGHDFVGQALAGGAAAALVSRRPEGVPEGAPLLVVPDVLAALAALGRAGRARAQARVLAVTGSAGKTSAKEMLARALGAEGGGVHAAERSFNNHWGVPLTLARLPARAAFAVIEIGMNAPGEIAPLARLARPDVALITTIAAAHLAAFGTLEAIAREKASVAEGLRAEGTLVIPADLPSTPILRAAHGRVVTFGEAAGADVRLLGADLGAQRSAARLIAGGRRVDLALAAPGRHHLMNALGALAAILAAGGEVEAAARRLARWQPPAGRGTREALRLPGAAITLIDEAFNANPASVSAALAVLARAPGRRVAVLGDMLELGEGEAALHAALAEDPGLRRAHVVHLLGPRTRALHEALPEALRGLWTEDAEAMAAALPGLLRGGDTVMVKGSKGIRASLVVDALRALGQPAPGMADDRGGAPLCSTG